MSFLLIPWFPNGNHVTEEIFLNTHLLKYDFAILFNYFAKFYTQTEGE